MMKQKAINFLNYNNGFLVHEISSEDEEYRTWVVVSLHKDVCYKARIESFLIDDIILDHDPIGCHKFSEFQIFSNIGALESFLEGISIKADDLVESWNTDYPL